MHSACMTFFIILALLVSVPAFDLAQERASQPQALHDHDFEAHFSAGFRTFHAKYFAKEHNTYESLQHGQKPLAFVIACADSRVDPAIVTNSAPGELFVVRNVANLVPPYNPKANNHGVSAALEYAVKHLRVPHIIVMGHANCGGIHALAHADASNAPTSADEFIVPWVNILHKAKDAVDRAIPHTKNDELLRAYEQAGVRVSISHLLTFPWVRNAVEEGRLRLHGWYFDLHKGALLELDAKTHTFVPLGDDAPSVQ